MTPAQTQMHADLRVLEAIDAENSGTQAERQKVIRDRAAEAVHLALLRVLPPRTDAA